MNKSIKETENLSFFSVRSNFISLMNTKTCFTSRHRCRRVVRSLIIVNKSIKETEKKK